MKEPWHLYFEGENTTKDKKLIEITGADLTSFMGNIQNQTSNISIDENSVILDMKNKIFKVKEGDTQVFGLRLRFNDENEQTCQSCINTINKNREYNPKTIKEIKWGNNNNRIAQIIAFYPIKTTN